MFFGKEKIRELNRQITQLKKENAEMANRVKEARNQIAVLKTHFDAQLDTIKTTVQASLDQIDRNMKDTMDRMQKDNLGFTMPHYINENY